MIQLCTLLQKTYAATPLGPAKTRGLIQVKFLQIQMSEDFLLIIKLWISDQPVPDWVMTEVSG